MKIGDVVRTIIDPLNPDYVNAGLRKGMLGVITEPPKLRRYSDALDAEVRFFEVRFFEAPDKIWAWSRNALEVVDA